MRRHWWWVLGLALVFGGVVLAIFARTDAEPYAWFACTPLSESADWQMSWAEPGGMSSAAVTTWWHLAGYTVVAAGVVVLAAGVGYRLGRRRVGRQDG